MVHVGLSLMIEEPFRRAALPLFEAGLVDALEHSFEIGWGSHPLPDWSEALLDWYADAGRLWGHGVTMSPFSAVAPRQHAWLERVGEACRRRPYVAVSEHVGFMVAGALDGGAPLPVPLGPASVRAGVDALVRLREVVRAPVGLENLALALGPVDALAQGPLLTAVLEAAGGYLVLDLHNLWCQAHNYGLDPLALLHALPLARVRCIHVSGGSWSEPRAQGRSRRFRRDTHDDDVPAAVHELLVATLPRCPALELVVLERLGDTLHGPRAEAALREDFARLRDAVAGRAGPSVALPSATSWPSLPVAPPLAALDEALLARHQHHLVTRLREGGEPESIVDALLGEPSLAPLHDYVASLDLHAVAVAAGLVARWGAPA